MGDDVRGLFNDPSPEMVETTAKNNVHLYTAHITWFHEIGRQHIEGASGCRFSPYVISPHPPTHPDQCTQRPDHNTGSHVPYSLRAVSGFFNVPQRVITNNGCETGPTVYRPYPRRLESLTICRCHYKGSTFSLSGGPAGV